MKPTLKTIIVLSLFATSTAVLADEATNSTSDQLTTITPQQFTWDATVAGLKEVRLGEIAEQNTTNADVKQFAEQMVKDHSRANLRLEKIAQAESLNLPDTNAFYVTINDQPPKQATQLMAQTPQEALDAQRITVQHLQALSGRDFDLAYASAMVEDHTNAVQLFENASANLTDKKLQKFATKTLPTLRGHYTMAQNLEDELNGIQSTNTTSNAQPAPMSVPN
jgi:putative membrane protein